MVLHSKVDDSNIEESEIEECRKFCQAMSGLHDLRVQLQPYKDDSHKLLWADGIVNRFRVLGSLCLEHADVRIVDTCGHIHPEHAVNDIRSSIKAALLHGSAINHKSIPRCPENVFKIPLKMSLTLRTLSQVSRFPVLTASRELTGRHIALELSDCEGIVTGRYSSLTKVRGCTFSWQSKSVSTRL